MHPVVPPRCSYGSCTAPAQTGFKRCTACRAMVRARKRLERVGKRWKPSTREDRAFLVDTSSSSSSEIEAELQDELDRPRPRNAAQIRARRKRIKERKERDRAECELLRAEITALRAQNAQLIAALAKLQDSVVTDMPWALELPTLSARASSS